MPIEDYFEMEVDVSVVREKAILVSHDQCGTFWVPRSVLKDDWDQKGENVKLLIARWWLRRNDIPTEIE